MSLKGLFNHIRLHNHTKQVQVLQGIRSAEEFRAVLHRERARANRNGHEFSLVVFDLGSVNQDSVRARRLTQVLSHRVRATDEIGWFDERRIGLVLPYTALEGALKVAETFCQRIATGAWRPSYTVYAYPSRWMAGDDGNDPEDRLADISP